MTVGAKATACQPCGAKPLDIMIVLDRTGSMAEGGTPNKLANAKSGIMTFLNFLDAGTAQVGLAVLPPATSLANQCVTGADANYDSASSKYLVVPLSTDFKVNGAINPSSNLITTLNCQSPGGVTHYSLAIQAAQAELATPRPAGVQKVIVFLTDGAANTGPHYFARRQHRADAALPVGRELRRRGQAGRHLGVHDRLLDRRRQLPGGPRRAAPSRPPSRPTRRCRRWPPARRTTTSARTPAS